MAKSKKASKLATSDAVPTARQLLKTVFKTLKTHYRPYLVTTLIFMLVYVAFVGVGSQIDPVEIKEYLNTNYADNSKFINDTIILSAVFGGGVLELSQIATSYGLFLILIVSLAYLWIARQIWADKQVSVRDAFYKGMYPMVPVLILILLLSIQLLPLTLGNYILITVVSNGLAASVIEKVFIGSGFVSLALLSGWLAVPTVLGLFISTLPNMTPKKAWQAGKELAKGRRLRILSRMFTGGLLMFVVSSLILLIVVAGWTGAAPVVGAIIAACLLPVANLYLYALYRGL